MECTTFLVVVYLLGYLSGISLRESQLPLRLAWAPTIHKSQDYTSKSIYIDIGKFERTAGVSYAVLSGYITTLNIKQKIDVSSEGPSSRVSSRDRGKCTGFYTKSMKASRDKKINQLDGFNHNKV